MLGFLKLNTNYKKYVMMSKEYGGVSMQNILQPGESIHVTVRKRG